MSPPKIRKGQDKEKRSREIGDGSQLKKSRHKHEVSDDYLIDSDNASVSSISSNNTTSTLHSMKFNGKESKDLLLSSEEDIENSDDDLEVFNSEEEPQELVASSQLEDDVYIPAENEKTSPDIPLFTFGNIVIIAILLCSAFLMSPLYQQLHPTHVSEPRHIRQCIPSLMPSLSSWIPDPSKSKLEDHFLLHSQPLPLFILKKTSSNYSHNAIIKTMQHFVTFSNDILVIQTDDPNFKSEVINHAGLTQPVGKGCYEKALIVMISDDIDRNIENLEWLESAIDDTRPILHGTVRDYKTNNWIIAFIERDMNPLLTQEVWRIQRKGKWVSDRWAQRLVEVIVI